MSENSFGAIIHSLIRSPQYYYFIQPHTVLLIGKMASKLKNKAKAKKPHPTLDASIGKTTGNVFGVMHSNEGAGRKADMASHEH